MRTEVGKIDKTAPVFDVKPMQEVIRERMSPKRLVTLMLGIFSLTALLLAAVGVFAVMSHAITQRTHEIGIRIAVGAQPRHILRLVVGQGMMLTLIGLVLGLAGAFGMTRAMGNILLRPLRKTLAPSRAKAFATISLPPMTVAPSACYLTVIET